MAEPRTHGFADEVLLRDGQLAGGPAVADLLEERVEDLVERHVDAVQRERLVDEEPDARRVAGVDRLEDRAELILRRARRRDVDRAEQGGRLADPVALAQPLAEPFDARDVPLVVAPLPARRPRRAENLVALLP